MRIAEEFLAHLPRSKSSDAFLFPNIILNFAALKATEDLKKTLADYK